MFLFFLFHYTKHAKDAARARIFNHLWFWRIYSLYLFVIMLDEESLAARSQPINMEVYLWFRINFVSNRCHHVGVSYQGILITHNFHDHFWPVLFVIFFHALINNCLLLLIYLNIFFISNQSFLNAKFEEVWGIGVILLAKRHNLTHVFPMPAIESCGDTWRRIVRWHKIFTSLQCFHLVFVVFDYAFIFIAWK